MSLLDRFERRFRRYGVPNVTLFLIFCQVLTYIAAQTNPKVLEMVALVPASVIQNGEVWRLFTFLATPPMDHPLLAFFFWYFFYFSGTALEAHWGALRYNLYLLIGWLAAAVSFLTPQLPVLPAFLETSVFLAFAFLFPDFVIYLFFLIPVKIKWAALLTWIGYFFLVLSGPWSIRFLVAASVLNYFVFFGSTIAQRMRFGHRRIVRQADRIVPRNEPFHRCTVCGITDRTHPDMDFRYCTRCGGQYGYCSQHIRNHEHIVPGDNGNRAAEPAPVPPERRDT